MTPSRPWPSCLEGRTMRDWDFSSLSAPPPSTPNVFALLDWVMTLSPCTMPGHTSNGHSVDVCWVCFLKGDKRYVLHIHGHDILLATKMVMRTLPHIGWPVSESQAWILSIEGDPKQHFVSLISFVVHFYPMAHHTGIRQHFRSSCLWPSQPQHPWWRLAWDQPHFSASGTAWVSCCFGCFDNIFLLRGGKGIAFF